jgi:hypothetical protein
MNTRDPLADAMRLQAAIEDTQGLLDRLEAAIDRIDAARNQFSVLGDEVRNQSRLMKERIHWLTREMDKLKRLVKEATHRE